MMNKAIFTKLYLDSIDRQLAASTDDLAEPYASLVHAVRTTDGHDVQEPTQEPTNA